MHGTVLERATINVEFATESTIELADSLHGETLIPTYPCALRF